MEGGGAATGGWGVGSYMRLHMPMAQVQRYLPLLTNHTLEANGWYFDAYFPRSHFVSILPILT